MKEQIDKYILHARKRFVVPAIILVAINFWAFLCSGYYDSYWNQTIFKVQTTDFNMLHHTLPITLSQLIIAGQDDQVQKVLDSTFGLFGIVITDPEGSTILYKTSKAYHLQTWQNKVSADGLAKIAASEPFDLLTDPPPLGAAWEHKSPRDAKATRETHVPSAGKRRVLGRVYLVRPNPPEFFDDLMTFAAGGFFEQSGSKRGYMMISIITSLVVMVALLMFWLRRRGLRLKQVELDHAQRELEIRKRALEHVTSELSEQRTRKIWLEREADDAYKRALRLKQSLEKLRDSLSLVGDVAVGANVSEPLNSNDLRIRPVVHPPSALLEEIETLLPALTGNATNLRSQATLLHDYCSILEEKQQEMKNIVDTAYTRANVAGANNLDMSPR